MSLVIRLALFALGLVVAGRQLRGLTLEDLWSSLRGFGASALALALTLTAVSFGVLGVLELFALDYAGKRTVHLIPRRTAMATAFVAHAYSQSVGLAILTGGAVRVRSYLRYGLDAVDVARMSVFVTVSATLGLLTTGGIALVANPRSATFAPIWVSPFWVGVALIGSVAAYVAWAAFGQSDFHGRGRWRVRRPKFDVAIKQVLAASLDWVVAGSVLFVLLPPSISLLWSAFIGMYLIAQTVAVMSHVPGGLGVFEAIIIGMLVIQPNSAPSAPALAASIAASLVVYRVVYYLIPLVGALVLSFFAEVAARRSPTTTTADQFHRTNEIPLTVPDAL